MADAFLAPTTYADHEKNVITHADYFVACDRRGAATYAKAECKDREQAKRAARTLIATRENTQHSKGRPVLVYAIMGTHQVMSDLVYP